MDTAYFYDVSVNWTAGRTGMLVAPGLSDKIEVATPPGFDKGVPGIWSPEHLLVAAVNSCLMTTFLAIADNSKFVFDSFNCHATGKLEKVEGKYMISEITLSPIVKIRDSSAEAKAMLLLRKSEAACLISNSIKAKIVFNPEVEVAEMM